MNVKNIFNNLSSGGFSYLIEIYFNVTSMIREFIYSDPKITVIIISLLIISTIYSFVKRIVPLLILGAVLIVIFLLPELIDKIPFADLRF